MKAGGQQVTATSLAEASKGTAARAMVTSTMKHEALKGLDQGTHEGRTHSTTLACMPSRCKITGQDLDGVGWVAGKAKQSRCRTGAHGRLACIAAERNAAPAYLMRKHA